MFAVHLLSVWHKLRLFAGYEREGGVQTIDDICAEYSSGVKQLIEWRTSGTKYTTSPIENSKVTSDLYQYGEAIPS